MKTLSRLLGELRTSIKEIDPGALDALRRDCAASGTPLVIIDLRDHDELQGGVIPGSLHLPRGNLELHIERLVPHRDVPIVLYCSGGVRSLLAAESLERMGYKDVASLAGGTSLWRQRDFGLVEMRTLSAAQRQRYLRHLSIPEVGEAGQLALLEAKVLLIGAGGLGSPAAFYLAAAGVGTLGIVDDDRVDLTNLQRQILHTTDRVGQPKTTSARAALLALDPAANIVAHPTRLQSDNVDAIVADYDVIVDGSDNFATRYLVNDACVKHQKPNVHGSVFRFEGQVSVFYPGRGPCYRCLYPEPPPPEQAPSCAEAGILGVMPGVIGLLQAVETIKLILELGDPLIGRLLHYDALRGEFRELRLKADEGCAYCAEGREFPGYVDYQQFCRKQP